MMESSKQELLQQLAEARRETHALCSNPPCSLCSLCAACRSCELGLANEKLTGNDDRLRELAEKGEEGARRGDQLATRASELGEKVVAAEEGRARAEKERDAAIVNSSKELLR
jgi:hypothetical protein